MTVLPLTPVQPAFHSRILTGIKNTIFPQGHRSLHWFNHTGINLHVDIAWVHEPWGSLSVNMLWVCNEARRDTHDSEALWTFCLALSTSLMYLPFCFLHPDGEGEWFYKKFRIPSPCPFNVLHFFSFTVLFSGPGELISPQRERRKRNRKQGGPAFGRTNLKGKAKGQKSQVNQFSSTT